VLLDAIVATIALTTAQAPPAPPAPHNGPPTLSIEGRVVDEQGEPMPRMRMLLSYPGEAGIVAPLSFSGSNGGFRLAGLKPGEYRLCADPGPIFGLLRTEGRFEGEFPMRACEAVSLSTQSRSDVEIKIRRGLLYSISASLVDAAGNALSEAGFEFALRDGPPLGSVDIKRPGDGRLVVRGVPPGDYVMTARRVSPNGTLLELGSSSIRVTSADVENVVVRTTKPVRIVGRVEFVDALSATSPKINVNTVGLRSRPPGQFENASHVGEDMTFQIDGLLGPQMLQVFGAMTPWAVKAIRYRGDDIYGKFVEFRTITDPGDLVIVLTNQSASVTPKLRSPAGQAGAGTTVVLIPLDSKTGTALDNAVFRPIDGEAPFGLPPVRPGDYLIAAITADVSAGPPSSVARRLMRVAQRITLAPGEHRVIELDIVRPR